MKCKYSFINANTIVHYTYTYMDVCIINILGFNSALKYVTYTWSLLSKVQHYPVLLDTYFTTISFK